MVQGAPSRAFRGSPSLRRGASTYLVGNLVYIASQFFMLLAVARLSDVEEVGRYALALAITAPIYSFSSLKLREVHIADAQGAFRPADFYRVRATTNAAAFSVSLIAASFFDVPTALTVAAVGVFKAAESQLEIIYGTLQRYEHIGAVAQAQAARGGLGLIAFTFVLAATQSLPLSVLVSTLPTAWYAIRTRCSLARYGIDVGNVQSRSSLVRLVRESAPLGVSVAIGTFAVAVPRYFLEGAANTQAVGVFAALAYILVLPATLATAVSEVAMPKLANHFARGERAAFFSLLGRLIAVGTGIGLVGIAGVAIAGKQALGLLYGADYRDEWSVLLVLMASGTVQFATLYIGTAAQATQMFKVQVPINVMSIFALSLACWALVPSHGLLGAASAVALSQVVLSVLYVYLLATRISPAVRRRAPKCQA